MTITPEQAAARAVTALDKASAHSDMPEVSAALVRVADGWTRLYATLSTAPPTPKTGTVNMGGPAAGEPAEIAPLPVEVRQLVHAVDAMRDGWAEADVARRQELWQRVHQANDALWERHQPES